MRKDENIIENAVEALKNKELPNGPSKELTNATVEKLNQISSCAQQQLSRNNPAFLSSFKGLIKIAAVVFLLITIGYAVGRFSSPKPPDMVQIQSALEPAIREKLLEEVTQSLQSGLNESYVLLREELIEQYRQDLNQAALDILTASGTITNQLLEELIYSIETAQAQDRQWITASLEQIELNRLEDKTQLSNALVSFASRTEDELQRTQQDMALITQFISDTQSVDPIPNEQENTNN